MLRVRLKKEESRGERERERETEENEGWRTVLGLTVGKQHSHRAGCSVCLSAAVAALVVLSNVC